MAEQTAGRMAPDMQEWEPQLSPLAGTAFTSSALPLASCGGDETTPQPAPIQLPPSAVPLPEVLPPLDGFLPISQKAGVGVTGDEGAVRDARRHRGRWRNPVWRQRNGNFAEW